MKIVSCLLRLLLLIGTPSFFVAEIAAAEGNAIGKVVSVEGQVQANDRSLSRGSPIFVSDVIAVSDKSKVQIKFTDGGVVNLIPSTQYSINSYQVNKGGGSNYSAELAAGGFRALSGSIGKSDADNYEVKTPTATIGIRGTLFEANIVDGETFFGCTNGNIIVSNEAGERSLHAGQFVSATAINQLGAISRVRPAALSPSVLAPPAGGVSLQKAMPSNGPLQKSTEKKLETKEEKGSKSSEKQLKEIHIQEHEGNPGCK